MLKNLLPMPVLKYRPNLKKEEHSMMKLKYLLNLLMSLTKGSICLKICYEFQVLVKPLNVTICLNTDETEMKQSAMAVIRLCEDQVDLSLGLMHISFCSLCHVIAETFLSPRL